MKAQPTMKAPEIEKYFVKYSDLPKEMIIKEDILRQGVTFTEEALQAAEPHRTKAYHIFSFDRSDVGEMQKREVWRVSEAIRISGGIYSLRPTCIEVMVNLLSPYIVDMVDDKAVMMCEGQVVGEVEFAGRPKWWSITLDDGTLCSEVGPALGWQMMPCLSVLRGCQYWGDKQECLYCDINANIRQQIKMGKIKTIGAKITPKQAAEAMVHVFGEFREPDTHSYIITGGQIIGKVDGKNEDEFYLAYVEAIKEKIGNRWHCLLQTSAKDKATCQRYRALGVDVHHANIEVWDKRLFQAICPGKDAYIGRDEWIKRVVESVEVFGEGNVNPAIVSGVEMSKPHGFDNVDEAVKSTAEGLDFLMSHGVTPRFTHWVPEPLSSLGAQEPPPLDYFIRINQAWYETWRKYDLVPLRGAGAIGPGRAHYGHSAFLDTGY